MNSQILPAIKECMEYIAQEVLTPHDYKETDKERKCRECDRVELISDNISESGPCPAYSFNLAQIIAEQYDEYWDNDRRPDSWRVTAYDNFGKKYKYAWYISESGMITADGS